MSWTVVKKKWRSVLSVFHLQMCCLSASDGYIDVNLFSYVRTHRIRTTEMSLCDITERDHASDGCTKFVILKKNQKKTPVPLVSKASATVKCD